MRVAYLETCMKVIALLALTFMCVTVSIAVLRLENLMNNLGNTVNQRLTSLSKTEQAVNKLLVNTKDLVIHTDITEVQQSKMLVQVNTKLQTTLDNVNVGVASLSENESNVSEHLVGTLDATTQTVHSVQPVIDSLHTDTLQLGQNLAALQVTENNLNTLIANPDIPQSLAHTDAILASGQQIAADGQHLVHSYVYPKPIVTAVHWTLDVVHALNPF
jgi:hypothetical protein